MKIIKITIVCRSTSTDYLFLRLDLPNGCYPYKGNATATLNVAQGTGVEYCKKNFPGIPVEVITESTW